MSASHEAHGWSFTVGCLPISRFEMTVSWFVPAGRNVMVSSDWHNSTPLRFSRRLLVYFL